MNEASPQQRPRNESLLESVASTFFIFTIWIFAITFAVQNFVIPSASMASTLLVGDHVLVDRATFAPPETWAPFVQHRDPLPSDLVVFFKPTTKPTGDHDILVKRIIGVPGDRIHLLHGTVYRNGAPQVEPHATQPTADSYDPYRDDFPSVLPNQPGVTATWSLDLPAHIVDGDLVVPPGSYFVMGDNRANSSDGRYWGFVPRANIIGRPLLVYWSFPTPDDEMNKTTLSDKVSFLTHEAVNFFNQTRWRRTLKILR